METPGLSISGPSRATKAYGFTTRSTLHRTLYMVETISLSMSSAFSMPLRMRHHSHTCAQVACASRFRKGRHRPGLKGLQAARSGRRPLVTEHFSESTSQKTAFYILMRIPFDPEIWILFGYPPESSNSRTRLAIPLPGNCRLTLFHTVESRKLVVLR